MKVVQVTSEERRKMIFSKRVFREADVAIVDGVIVKNRNGDTGKEVGAVMVIWDEEPE